MFMQIRARRELDEEGRPRTALPDPDAHDFPRMRVARDKTGERRAQEGRNEKRNVLYTRRPT